MAVITNTKTMNITVDHFNEIIPLLEKLFNNEYPTNEEIVNILQQYVSQEALTDALTDYVTTEKLDEKTAGLQGLTQEQIEKINKVTELEATITTLNEKIVELQTKVEALEKPVTPPDIPPTTTPTLTSIQVETNIPSDVSITTSTPLEDLKQYIVVNGEYDDRTTKEITEYELQGTLTIGTSTITVVATENDSITTTFDVTVA